MAIEEREKAELETVNRWLDLFDLAREQAYNSAINIDTMNIAIKEWIRSIRQATKKEVGV